MDSGILLTPSVPVSQTALVANTTVSINPGHFYALVLALVFCDTSFATRIKRIGLCRERVLDASRRRHANASRAILIRVVFEAPGFSWTRIIHNDYPETFPSGFPSQADICNWDGTAASGEATLMGKSRVIWSHFLSRLARDNDPGDRLAYTSSDIGRRVPILPLAILQTGR